MSATHPSRQMRETDVPNLSTAVTAAARANHPYTTCASALRLRFEFDTAHTHTHTHGRSVSSSVPLRGLVDLLGRLGLVFNSFAFPPDSSAVPPLRVRAGRRQLRGETRPDDLARPPPEGGSLLARPASLPPPPGPRRALGSRGSPPAPPRPNPSRRQGRVASRQQDPTVRNWRPALLLPVRSSIPPRGFRFEL